MSKTCEWTWCSRDLFLQSECLERFYGGRRRRIIPAGKAVVRPHWFQQGEERRDGKNLEALLVNQQLLQRVAPIVIERL
jgi:hypothetical protein